MSGDDDDDDDDDDHHHHDHDHDDDDHDDHDDDNDDDYNNDDNNWLIAHLHDLIFTDLAMTGTMLSLMVRHVMQHRISCILFPNVFSELAWLCW